MIIAPYPLKRIGGNSFAITNKYLKNLKKQPRVLLCVIKVDKIAGSFSYISVLHKYLTFDIYCYKGRVIKDGL